MARVLELELQDERVKGDVCLGDEIVEGGRGEKRARG